MRNVITEYSSRNSSRRDSSFQDDFYRDASCEDELYWSVSREENLNRDASCEDKLYWRASREDDLNRDTSFEDELYGGVPVRDDLDRDVSRKDGFYEAGSSGIDSFQDQYLHSRRTWQSGQYNHGGQPTQLKHNQQSGQLSRNFESLHKGIDSVIRPFAWSFGAAQELVFPRRCPVCDRPVRPAGALICSDCEDMLQRVEEPVCRRCGKPLRFGTSHLCGDCRSIQHIYERGCAVFTYHSTAGGLFRFKYGGRQEYGAFYGRCMAEKLAEFAAGPGGAGNTGQVFAKELTWSSAQEFERTSKYGLAAEIERDPVQEFSKKYMAASGKQGAGRLGKPGVKESGKGAGKGVSKGLSPAVPEIVVRGPSRPDFLVPVPVSEHRLEKRGYNQALILAGEISRLTGIPMRDDILFRISDTRPMKNMAPVERQNNLKKAFQVFGNDVELNSIMLIDDIYTTGATIDACAHALYKRGAQRVFFMTLAIGEDSRF